MLAQRPERFPVGPLSRTFRRRYFPEVELAQWNDWRWQARNRIRTLAELERVFVLSDDEREAVMRQQGSLPLGITPYYMSLMAREDAMEPLRRTHIPVGTEYLKMPGEADDPLGEDGHTAAPGLVHRYPDRVLFLVTRLLLDLLPLLHALAHGRRPERRDSVSCRAVDEALDYIAAHPEIRDVLISGGDPLALSDDRLDWLLGAPARHPARRVLRIGTKVPAVLPQRITPALVRDAEEASSAVDERALHASERADAGGHRGVRAAGRRRHSARQPDGASAQGRERRRRDS